MFVYLCNTNKPKLLFEWLVKETNYFSDGVSPSPISETSVVSSKVVHDWLYRYERERAHIIYSGIQLKELESILKLP